MIKVSLMLLAGVFLLKRRKVWCPDDFTGAINYGYAETPDDLQICQGQVLMLLLWRVVFSNIKDKHFKR